MPSKCLFLNCSSVPKVGGSLSFYKIPLVQRERCREIEILTEKRRNAWTKIINLDLTEKELKNGRVCEKHFLSGRPAFLEDQNNPDWVPCKNLGFEEGHAVKRKSDLDRFERSKRRSYPEIKMVKALIEKSLNPQCDKAPNISFPNKMTASNDVISVEENLNENLNINEDESENITKELVAIEARMIQTDLTSEQLSLYFNDMNFTNSLILQLRHKMDKLTLTEVAFKDNDAKTKYFTGISSYKILSFMHEIVAPFLIFKSDASSLSSFQQLILTLMKLRLNFHFKYLADRFDKSPATISQYFDRCLDVLYSTFKGLVYWPSKEALIKTMPSCFKKSFKTNVAVIMDCFEIFTESPSNLYTGAQCWSNYKHHKTVKILIGITPQGTISFISDVYGGRISDKALTLDCGILEKLRPSDVILADRGFLIEDSVRQMNAHLGIPAFTRGKSQLNPLELEETRSIAHVRIHVERVIGSLRQKYTILSGILPISLLANVQGEKSQLDKIVCVCSAMYNLNPSIVT